MTTSAPLATLHRQVPQPIRQLLILLNAIAPPLLWAGFIFMFSSQQVLPSLEVSSMDFVMKKIAHMTIYAVLYLLLVRASYVLNPTSTHRSPAKKYWLLPLGICLIYALSDELHQGITGGSRTPSLRDVVYDMIGAGVVFLKQYKYI